MRKKVYGQGQTAQCPFCGDSAYEMNEQNVPVCKAHKQHQMPGLKCVCGGWLDHRKSKYGVFFTCMDCGPVSFKKMLEVNGDAIIEAAHKPPPKPEREVRRSSSPFIIDRIRKKIKNGEPLTEEELEFL